MFNVTRDSMSDYVEKCQMAQLRGVGTDSMNRKNGAKNDLCCILLNFVITHSSTDFFTARTTAVIFQNVFSIFVPSCAITTCGQNSEMSHMQNI